MSDIYSSVRKKPKSKRDLLLPGLIALVVVVFIAALSPVLWSARQSWQFKVFVQELTESVLDAKERGEVLVRVGENEHPLPRESLEKLYESIVVAGMGKTDAPIPDAEPAELDFPDGSILRLWAVPLIDQSGQSVTGAFIWSQGRGGRIYSYSTPQISGNQLLETLGNTD